LQNTHSIIQTIHPQGQSIPITGASENPTKKLSTFSCSRVGIYLNIKLTIKKSNKIALKYV